MKLLYSIFFALVISVSVFSADFPDIEGWKPDGEIKSFDSETLWEYINGAAELFLAYDFQELRVADLASTTLDEMIVTVSIYDQGSSLNAFGVYHTEKPDNGAPVSGLEAMVMAPYQALLLKDQYYVKVDAYEGEIDLNVGSVLLQAVADALTGSPGLPEEMNWLPEKDVVAGSFGYMRQGFLGLEDLNRCVHAEYALKRNKTFKGFLMLPGSNDSVDDLWGMLASKWKAKTYKKMKLLYREIPYQGFAGVVRTDRGLLGASGFDSDKDLFKRLHAFMKE